jgi:hypothetical protein
VLADSEGLALSDGLWDGLDAALDDWVPGLPPCPQPARARSVAAAVMNRKAFVARAVVMRPAFRRQLPESTTPRRRTRKWRPDRDVPGAILSGVTELAHLLPS